MSSSPLQENDNLSEINVTPFVDVLLVLLVIFMVTAPILNHVVQVDLPQDSFSQDKIKPMEDPLRVVVDREGVLYLDDAKIGLSAQSEIQQQFQEEVRRWKEKKSEPWLVDLEADENVRYGALVPVIARLKELGVSLNLVIQPKPRG
ncbi:MAG: biopolymer transporter ExbD [bacterium]|jgi:biopolymer transport protein ExbD